MVKFGSARISENNSVHGQPGDQTSYEVMEQPAYWHRNGWRGVRAKDPQKAVLIAFVMICACRSNLVGYSQPQRNAIFWWDSKSLTQADCSTLVPYCVIKAGIDVNINDIWTGNLIERLLETGQFDTFEVTSLEALCTGDILVDGNLTSHTVVVTEGNTRPYGNIFDVAEPTLSVGSKGAEVRKLQAFFNEYGDGCTVDGDYEFETFCKVCVFQSLMGIKVDGIYGRDTKDMAVFFLWSRNVRAV